MAKQGMKNAWGNIQICGILIFSLFLHMGAGHLAKAFLDKRQEINNN